MPLPPKKEQQFSRKEDFLTNNKIGLQKQELSVNRTEMANKELIHNMDEPKIQKISDPHKNNHKRAIEFSKELINKPDPELGGRIIRTSMGIRQTKRNRELFVESEKYTHMRKELKSTTQNVATIESKFRTILNLKETEDSKLIELSEICEDLQKRLLLIDRIIFQKYGR